MKKHYYIIVLMAIIITSCEKTDTGNDFQITNNTAVVDNVNRPIRPIILGKQLNNPFSVKNMQIALDSLLANKDSLNGSMRAPGALNDFEIKATDLYIRYLPKDSAEYRTLMNDTSLTLFDFPLDYELKQVGEYYKDPTVTGEYTWLYTRVPAGYTPHPGIKYEVLEELFILEHSPYYSIETETDENGIQKAKSIAGQNNNEALRVLQTVSLYLTGNLKQDRKDKKTYTNNVKGMQKAKSYVTVRIFGKTIILATFYYPSGFLKIKAYHTMNGNGVYTSHSSAVDVPLKGIKMHFLTWFDWGSAYTDEYGYYQSDESYLLDPIHTIYFSGRTKDQKNSWDMDRAILGVCLWVQKLCLGVQSKDNYNATIDETSDAWDACIANNIFYEYMAICDREGLTRPCPNLKVALSAKGGGLNGAPLLQNHLNNYASAIIAHLALTFSPLFGPAIALLAAAPDIVISTGWISGSNLITGFPFLYRNIWHELTHASNYQCVEKQKGYWYASYYWSDVVGSEIVLDNIYGKEGDMNWQQIALVEGWAYYNEFRYQSKYLNGDIFSGYTDSLYPEYYANMFYNLNLIGCSNSNLEKCLAAKTLADYRDLLIEIYPWFTTQITDKIKEYE